MLSLTSVWRPYVGFSGEMALLALNSAIGIAMTCLISFEMAQNRFGFLRYMVPLLVVKTVMLLSLCGCSFFCDLVPTAMAGAVAALNPNSLSFLVAAFLAFNAIGAVMLAIDVFTVRPAQKPRFGFWAWCFHS